MTNFEITDLKEIDKYIGNRLKTKREELNLSQKELCIRTGISIQRVLRYERGTNTIPLDVLYKLSKVLGVSVDWFFEGMDV